MTLQLEQDTRRKHERKPSPGIFFKSLDPIRILTGPPFRSLPRQWYTNNIYIHFEGNWTRVRVWQRPNATATVALGKFAFAHSDVPFCNPVNSDKVSATRFEIGRTIEFEILEHNRKFCGRKPHRRCARYVSLKQY